MSQPVDKPSPPFRLTTPRLVAILVAVVVFLACKPARADQITLALDPASGWTPGGLANIVELGLVSAQSRQGDQIEVSYDASLIEVNDVSASVEVEGILGVHWGIIEPGRLTVVVFDDGATRNSIPTRGDTSRVDLICCDPW